MAEEGFKRKLTAILSADVAGLSKSVYIVIFCIFISTMITQFICNVSH